MTGRLVSSFPPRVYYCPFWWEREGGEGRKEKEDIEVGRHLRRYTAEQKILKSKNGEPSFLRFHPCRPFYSLSSVNASSEKMFAFEILLRKKTFVKPSTFLIFHLPIHFSFVFLFYFGFAMVSALFVIVEKGQKSL